VSLGLVLVNTINPGSFVDEGTRIKNRISYESWANGEGIEILDGKSFLSDPQYAEYIDDAGLELLDEKSLAAAQSKLETAKQAEETGPMQFLVDMVPENIVMSVGNNGLMLQVIFFAIFFGISLALLPEEKVSGLKSFINGTSNVFLQMVDIIMKAAPFFVFALMAGVLSKMAWH
jgi:L-cystine uptake protein TcyP (sodium:dicarboxylate symporter family)